MDQPIEDLTTSKARVTFDPTLYQSGDDDDHSEEKKLASPKFLEDN